MPTEQGYNNQKKKGQAQFKTIHGLGSDKFGVAVALKSLFDVNAIPAALSNITISLEGGKPTFYTLEVTGVTNPRVGDILKITSGALAGWELDIVAVAGAIITVPFITPVGVDLTTSMDAKVMRYVTNKADSDGNANFSPGPTQFIRNGVAVQVTKDTSTPSNTLPLPVEIVSASGTEINITAGDINIQTTDMGVNFDSMRVGDGTGNYIGVTTNAEVQTPPVRYLLDGVRTEALKDTVTPANSRGLPVEILNPSGVPTDIATETTLLSVDAELVTLNAKDFATETTLASVDAELVTLNTVDFATETTLATLATEATAQSIDAELVTLNTTDFATETTLATLATEATAASIDAELVTLNAKDFATEATLSAVNTAQGAITDAAVTNPASNASVIAALKGLLSLITAQTAEINKGVANGATQSNSTVSTTAANVAIPANTVGFIIQGFTGNAGLYWSLGGTAANDGTSGHKLEDSRDSGYIPYGGTGNLSVIGEAAGTRYQITWFTRS